MLPCKILVVDCDADELTSSFAAMLRTVAEGQLQTPGLSLTGPLDKRMNALTGGINRHQPEIVVLCFNRSGGADARLLLSVRRKCRCAPAFAIAVDAIDSLTVSKFLELGVEEYFSAPFRAIDVFPRLARLHFERAGEDTLVTRLKATLGLQKLVGEDVKFLETLRRIPAAARCDATVLILGESGTGKEACAQAIHHVSRRSGQPFLAVNCGAIPENLVENELFGHARGAYTDAGSPANGMIQQCEGGTLFLDEVDCLPLSAQVKLLRFLQEREYRPLGAPRSSRANVRVVAASNQDLRKSVQSGSLRPDLYYRLNVIALELPPLRERKGDIPMLARHFLDTYTTGLDRPKKELSRGALNKLLLHDWPGNIRELENVIQGAIVFSENTVLHAEDIRLPVEMSADEDESFAALKARAVAQFERGYLVQQLQKCDGNITRAARAARKDRRAFWELMRKHQVAVSSTRTPTQSSED